MAAWPGTEELAEEIHQAAGSVAGVEEIELDFVVMTDEERAELRHRLRAGMGGRPSTSRRRRTRARPRGTRARARRRRCRPSSDRTAKTRVIGVSSGKGGVGKSTVTVNLAIALAQAGYQVGLLDADVYGFSVPKMLGTDHDPIIIGDMVIPTSAHGVKCLSMGYFVPDDQPVIWRGPMLHKAIQQFLTDAYWGEPDFVLIDMPPGTGDVALTLAEVMPRAEIIVVTTPQAAAQRVAQRSAFAARRLKLSVRGVIENMSWFTGDDGKRYELFGIRRGCHARRRPRDPPARSGAARQRGAPGWRRGSSGHCRRSGQRDGTGLPGHRREAGRARPGPGLPAGAQPALSRRARAGVSPHLRLATSRALLWKTTT